MNIVASSYVPNDHSSVTSRIARLRDGHRLRRDDGDGTGGLDRAPSVEVQPDRHGAVVLRVTVRLRRAELPCGRIASGELVTVVARALAGGDGHAREQPTLIGSHLHLQLPVDDQVVRPDARHHAAGVRWRRGQQDADGLLHTGLSRIADRRASRHARDPVPVVPPRHDAVARRRAVVRRAQVGVGDVERLGRAGAQPCQRVVPVGVERRSRGLQFGETRDAGCDDRDRDDRGRDSTPARQPPVLAESLQQSHAREAAQQCDVDAEVVREAHLAECRPGHRQ